MTIIQVSFIYFITFCALYLQYFDCKNVTHLRSQSPKCQLLKKPCSDLWQIRREDAVRFRSQFDLSDESNKKNTSSAWQAVGTRPAPYIGDRGKNVIFYLSGKNKQRFILRRVCVDTRHVRQISVVFCDTTKEQNHLLFCDRELTISKGVAKDVPVPIKGRIGTSRTCFSPYIVANKVRLYFLLNRVYGNVGPIAIKGLTVQACADKEHVKKARNKLDIDFTGQVPKPTKNKCQSLYQMTYTKSKEQFSFFTFNDGDPDREETLALSGSKKTYQGPPGGNVTFTFSAIDGSAFEMWRICFNPANVKKITYGMETSNEIVQHTAELCEDQNVGTKCFSYQQGLALVSGFVRLHLAGHKTSQISVKNMVITLCRDVNHYNFELHISAGDYKALTINTIKKQTVTIYGEKNTKGEVLDTELYHFTDNTGNLGDDTWFTLEPEHKLVSTIWTPTDHINLDWDVKNMYLKVSMEVKRRTYRADFYLNLRQFRRIRDRKQFVRHNKKWAKCRECRSIIVKVKRCGQLLNDSIVYANAIGHNNVKATIPARHIDLPGQYEIILPDGAQLNNKKEDLVNYCNVFAKMKARECEMHYFFLSQRRYHFICSNMRQVLGQHFTDEEKADRDRIYHACMKTFESLILTCRVTMDSSKEGQKPYLVTASQNGTNFRTFDLFRTTFSRARSQATFTARDNQAREFTTGTKLLRVDHHRKEPIVIERDLFMITRITKVPEPRIGHRYKLTVEYSCGTKTSDKLNIFGIVNLRTGGSTHNYKDCKVSGQSSCSVMMNPRNLTTSGEDFIRITYYKDNEEQLVRSMKVLYKQRAVILN